MMLRWPVFAFALLSPISVSANEFTLDFVDDVVSQCMSWMNSDDLGAFEEHWNDWVVSSETLQALEFAQLNDTYRSPNTLFLLSPDLNYVALLKPFLAQCAVFENFVGADGKGSVASPPVTFDYQSALSALQKWGSEQASNVGFVDWPEEAERRFVNDHEDFVFFKKRCDDDSLTTFRAIATPERVRRDGIEVPAWSIRISRYSMSDPDYAEYALKACPQVS